MKNQSYQRYLNYALLLSTGLLFGACGKKNHQPDYNDPRYYSPYYQNAGAACVIPTGIKDRTVVGNLGNGAVLQLDIFTQNPGGTIAAFGQLSVPSVESLFSANVFTGPFDANQTLTGYTGPNSAFTTCVSSNGYNGTLDTGSVYEDINLSLVGNGNTFIEMGDRVGVVSFLSGQSLRGSVKIRIGSYPETEFILP